MSGPAAPVLELVDIRAGYGPLEVLHGVSLTIGAGEVFALLGPNGGGKSTTLQVCAGLIEPMSGSLRVLGHDLTRVAPERLAAAGICTIPEGRGVFPNLSVRENLKMAAVTGKSLSDIEESAYGHFPRLGERRSQMAGTMSGGEQQMLAMARALTTDPAVLLLDELSMGLAPIIVDELYEVVGELATSGVSMLVVEQFARHVLGIANRAAIMLNGLITRTGKPQELEAELSDAYMGAS